MLDEFDEGYDDDDELDQLGDELDDLSETPMDRNGTWLMSYADLMTLVACFFIMLVAFANFDDPSFQEKAKEFARFFRGALLVKQGEVEDRIVTGPTTKKKKVKKNETKVISKKKKDLTTHVNQVVKRASISEISPPRDIEVVFSGSAMFAPGKIEITPEVGDSLDVMIDLIVSREGNFIVMVEGHTDDTDIKNRIYPSNWELSAARAATVLKRFEKAGIPADKLVAVGYGDSRPTYINRDDKGKPIAVNQRLNRRVVIKVLHDRDGPKGNLGLGVFFRDRKGKNIPKMKKNSNNLKK